LLYHITVLYTDSVIFVKSNPLFLEKISQLNKRFEKTVSYLRSRGFGFDIAIKIIKKFENNS